MTESRKTGGAKIFRNRRMCHGQSCQIEASVDDKIIPCTFILQSSITFDGGFLGREPWNAQQHAEKIDANAVTRTHAAGLELRGDLVNPGNCFHCPEHCFASRLVHATLPSV